jgi:ABC-type uncharacterized transport system involved in gliding motility auxiliary subunit
VEGLKPMAKWLALGGLLLAALGGLFYALSMQNPHYGLIAAAAGLALVAAGLMAARQQVGQAMGTRAFKLGLGSGAAVLAVAALVVFLGAMAERHHLRWDLSQGHKLSLAPQSIKVVDKLENPVKIYAFFKAGQAGYQQVKELLDLYAYHNRKITVQFVDLDNHPALANRFNVKTHGQLVIVGKGKEERVSLPDEQNMTNAFIRMTRTQKKVIYFIGGHGERDLKGIGKADFNELKKTLENQNYVVKPLILATQVSVPDDAVCIILAAPAKELLAVEKERIAAYLQKGGGVLMMIEPNQGAGLNDWLMKRGVVIGDNLVVDASAARIGASPFWPLGLTYGSHSVVIPLENVLTFFPIARTVNLAPKLPPATIGIELVMTGPQSWAEVDFREATEQPEFNEGRDLAGPVSLGVVLEFPKPAPKPEPETKKGDKDKTDKPPAQGGRLIVFGDADFASNEYFQQAGNRDLVLNSIAFLAQEADLISISPKQEASQPLMIQPSQARVVFWVPVVVLPIIFVIIGIMVVIRRRRPA